MDRRRPALGVLFVLGFVSLAYLVGTGVALALGRPALPLPGWVRALGLPLLAGGIVLVGWAGSHRGFLTTAESSYATLVKLTRRLPLEERHGRTEPLVVAGPYRLVRHPMYAGVVLLASGLALASASTAALVAALVFWSFFYFVLGPFEEREMAALFGAPYREYARRTRRLLPIPRRRER